MFVVLFALAAAALALWFDIRFPKLAPEGLRTIIGHGLVALVATDVAAAALGAAQGSAHVTLLTALLGAMLPALIYTFVVCLWMMRHFSGALHGSRR